MGRKILSFICAIIVVFVSLGLSEALAHQLFSDEFLLASVIVALALASALGYFTFFFVQKTITNTGAVIFGSALSVVNLLNLLSAEHPTWFWFLSFMAILSGYLLSLLLYSNIKKTA